MKHRPLFSPKGVHPPIVNPCLNLYLKDLFMVLVQRFLDLCEASVDSPGLERDYINHIDLKLFRIFQITHQQNHINIFKLGPQW